MAIDLECAKSSLPQGATLEDWFDEQFDRKIAAYKTNKTPKLSILVSKGTLDRAYPAFILSSTAAAVDWEVSVFFTFLWISSAEERDQTGYQCAE